MYLSRLDNVRVSAWLIMFGLLFDEVLGGRFDLGSSLEGTRGLGGVVARSDLADVAGTTAGSDERSRGVLSFFGASLVTGGGARPEMRDEDDGLSTSDGVSVVSSRARRGMDFMVVVVFVSRVGTEVECVCKVS